jgi:hypothetical protein
MRVMVLVKATEDSEKGFVPTAETKASMAAMGRLTVKQARLRSGRIDELHVGRLIIDRLDIR